MANKHLSREPHEINELNWWYEETKGIEIHSDQHTKVGEHICLLISWAEIRGALARKDKKTNK